MSTKLTLKHSDIFPSEADEKDMISDISDIDFICRYFSGVSDRRFGDLQSAAPCNNDDVQPEYIYSEYIYNINNGFADIYIGDDFIIKYMCRMLKHSGFISDMDYGRLSEPDPGAANVKYEIMHDKIYDTMYKKYVLSNYIFDIWGKEMLSGAVRTYEQHSEIKLDFKLHRLYVMTFFICKLSELSDYKSCPDSAGQLFRLYTILIDEIYKYFKCKAIKEACVFEKILAAAAINIPVYPEA